MDENIFDRDEFKCIEPEKLQIIKELAAKVKGKSTTEALSIFMMYQNRLSQGRELSENEKLALLTTIKANMTQEELAKFNKAMSIIGGMGKL